ncbi:hypothetical protein EDB84DRAFT_1440321 [Lactarius hengduanensis]|nr:hypothetical protein EDB84DRAFT_1440602 [Lactarius hengduanensis]KAH9025774.1 hypothetical protein EDB84DRAFT_1440321 [Lactarius hengduanensis]
MSDGLVSARMDGDGRSCAAGSESGTAASTQPSPQGGQSVWSGFLHIYLFSCKPPQISKAVTLWSGGCKWSRGCKFLKWPQIALFPWSFLPKNIYMCDKEERGVVKNISILLLYPNPVISSLGFSRTELKRRQCSFSPRGSTPALVCPVRVDTGARLPPRVIIVDSHNHPTIPTPKPIPNDAIQTCSQALARAPQGGVEGLKRAIGPLVTRINGMVWRIRVDLKVHLNVASRSGDMVDRSFGPIRFEFPRGVEAIPSVEGADQV